MCRSRKREFREYLSQAISAGVAEGYLIPFLLTPKRTSSPDAACSHGLRDISLCCAPELPSLAVHPQLFSRNKAGLGYWQMPIKKAHFPNPKGMDSIQSRIITGKENPSIYYCTQGGEQSCALAVSTMNFVLESIVLSFSFHALSMSTLAFVLESIGFSLPFRALCSSQS